MRLKCMRSLWPHCGPQSLEGFDDLHVNEEPVFHSRSRWFIVGKHTLGILNGDPSTGCLVINLFRKLAPEVRIEIAVERDDVSRQMPSFFRRHVRDFIFYFREAHGGNLSSS